MCRKIRVEGQQGSATSQGAVTVTQLRPRAGLDPAEFMFTKWGGAGGSRRGVQVGETAEKSEEVGVTMPMGAEGKGRGLGLRKRAHLKRGKEEGRKCTVKGKSWVLVELKVNVGPCLAGCWNIDLEGGREHETGIIDGSHSRKERYRISGNV